MDWNVRSATALAIERNTPDPLFPTPDPLFPTPPTPYFDPRPLIQTTYLAKRERREGSRGAVPPFGSVTLRADYSSL